MWYEYNDNVGVTRYIFSFVPEYMDKYVGLSIVILVGLVLLMLIIRIFRKI